MTNIPKVFYTYALWLLLIAIGMGAIFIHPSHALGKKGYINISMDQFLEMKDQNDVRLINVHVPYEGEIPGTDLFIPYDAVEENKEKLPREKDTPIIVYCKTGPMGWMAARELSGMGYTNLYHFSGGMDGWEESGRSLVFQEK